MSDRKRDRLTEGLVAYDSDSDSRSKPKKKHSRNAKDTEDEDHREKKKHKKSKKSGKDKHKDKDRDKNKEKHKDKKSDKDVQRRKSTEELSAIEKFNMFKKQREAARNDEGNVVDDLFKDFIASKIKQIEDESEQIDKNQKPKSKRAKVSDSVNELSKFLDEEINSMAKPTATEDSKSKSAEEVRLQTNVDSRAAPTALLGTDIVDELRQKEDELKVKATEQHRKSIRDTTTLGSLLKLDKIKTKTDNTENLKTAPSQEKNESITFKVDQCGANSLIPNMSTKGALSGEVNQTPIVLESIPLPSDSDNKEKGTVVNKIPPVKLPSEEKTEDSQSPTLPVFGPHLPSFANTSEKENVEAVVQVKKPTLGFKNFGIKLSSTSAELIQSGEIHKKGKRLEDGKNTKIAMLGFVL